MIDEERTAFFKIPRHINREVQKRDGDFSKVLIYLADKARWKDEDEPDGLKRGQLRTSIRRIGEDTKIKKWKVEEILKFLRGIGFVNCQTVRTGKRIESMILTLPFYSIGEKDDRTRITPGIEDKSRTRTGHKPGHKSRTPIPSSEKEKPGHRFRTQSRTREYIKKKGSKNVLKTLRSEIAAIEKLYNDYYRTTGKKPGSRTLEETKKLALILIDEYGETIETIAEPIAKYIEDQTGHGTEPQFIKELPNLLLMDREKEIFTFTGLKKDYENYVYEPMV